MSQPVNISMTIIRLRARGLHFTNTHVTVKSERPPHMAYCLTQTGFLFAYNGGVGFTGGGGGR
jgi:hypothetical protein